MTAPLKTQGQLIIQADGMAVQLKGVNLGGWLMMEAYFMYSPNYPEQKFKKEFQETLGVDALREFEHGFRSHFIQEQDIQNIAKIGFNCIRVPFNYRLLDQGDGTYAEDGLAWLDCVFDWSEQNNLWVILDLHATYGCQNHDWHSDSYGKAELWTDEENRVKTYALWEFVANRYKDRKALIGYDVLNESVTDDTKLLNEFYRGAIAAIRRSDAEHILFVEGNKWATDLNCIEPIEDHNYVLSIHTYEPLDFTFNFVPHLHYPLDSNTRRCNADTLRKHLDQYQKISVERDVPIFVGEFGVNYRQGLYGEHQWLEDNLKLFDEYGFHWTYWTYKAMKNCCYPDGIYSFVENPAWVHREGPLLGWETFSQEWPKQKDAMMHSWHTDQFEENTEVMKVIQKYV